MMLFSLLTLLCSLGAPTLRRLVLLARLGAAIVLNPSRLLSANSNQGFPMGKEEG